MSRLYTWVNTDTIKTTHTARGSQETHIRVNFGSKSDSKPLLEVSISYLKGKEKPEITIKSFDYKQTHLMSLGE